MDDTGIIELLNSGEDRKAMNEIIRNYSEKLYWHIRKMVVIHDDADDILQNSFIKIWEALPSFRQDSKLYTWIYRIATNEAITFLKKKKVKSFLSFSDYGEYLSNTIAADESFNKDKLLSALHQAIASLPPKQKAVFNLRYFDEMKYEDMSEILGTSTGALKASYHHAYTKILKYIREKTDID